MPTTRSHTRGGGESLGPPGDTAASQHDTRAISFTKPVQIFDNVVCMPVPPNITAEFRYARLVTSIQHLRGRLMQDEVLREPLLHILRGLYESPKSKEKISRICPIKPTDQDIIRFIDEFWPDLYLVKPTCHSSHLSSTGGSGPWDGARGHTFAGVDAQVQIIAPLIERWQSNNVSYNPPHNLPHEALCWLTSAVLAHEAAHRMVVWWSSGECGTPEMDGVEKEAGRYLENAWFGGETVAEFPEGKVGVFEEMISVGVEIADQYYPIDIQLATELQQMNTSNGLPFFHPHAASPISPGTVRVKAAQYATNKERFQINNPNLNITPPTGPSTSEPSVPVKTVIWRHLTNDKIQYKDRYLYGLV